MFDFKNAQWHRDTCRLTDNISVRLWQSWQRPDTYQVFLRWRDLPEEPSFTVYKRFITAKDRESAKRGAFAVIKRWMKKNTKVPDGMYLETYNMCLEQFGLPPLTRNPSGPANSKNAPSTDSPAPVTPSRAVCEKSDISVTDLGHDRAASGKENPRVKIKVFINQGEIEAVMSDSVTESVEVTYYNGSDSDRIAYRKAMEDTTNAGLREQPFTVRHAYGN